MATEIATLLRGKHKPIWAPHVDTGDHVIVVNASKLAIDPKKATDKLYHRHTGYPGGIRTVSLEQQMQKNAEKVVRDAVRRMLPKGPLGRSMLRKLRVYNGPTHPHRAQLPTDHPLPARALIALDPDTRPALKKAGLLARDAREKERRKYGLKKARKAPQYSKR